MYTLWGKKMKEENGKKYGYVCMTCGNTIKDGVNSDGECSACVNYAEKKERKLERYNYLSEKASKESTDAYERSHKMVEHIPMGQPILVGHHSEKAHRSLLDRSWNTMGKSVKLQEKADYYKQKADGTENNNAISSDDPAAVKKLKDKLQKLEEQREKIKQHNKEQRKKGESGADSYHLSNLSQNINSVKKRIVYLQKQESIQEVEEKYGEITLKVDKDDNRVRLLFPGKPSDEVRTKLKSKGFRWSPYNGAWQRQLNEWSIRIARELAQEVS